MASDIQVTSVKLWTPVKPLHLGTAGVTTYSCEHSVRCPNSHIDSGVYFKLSGSATPRAAASAGRKMLFNFPSNGLTLPTKASLP